MPRTGSELLQSYLAIGAGLSSLGEFLQIRKENIRLVRKVSDTGNIKNDFILETPDADLHKHLSLNFIKYSIEEFDRRLFYIKEHELAYGPVVVKVFVDTFYANPYISIEKLADNFNLVVLRRRNIFNSILSALICSNVGVWHIIDSAQVDSVRSRINSSKFTVSETSFYDMLRCHEYLKVIHKNILEFSPSAISLYYEDLADDPYTKLDLVFGLNVDPRHLVVNKFIDDHAACITNIDRLRKLYRLYSTEALDN